MIFHCRDKMTLRTSLCQHWNRTPTARFAGPIWGPSGADRTQVGPILAPWTLLSVKCRHVTKFSSLAVLKVAISTNSVAANDNFFFQKWHLCFSEQLDFINWEEDSLYWNGHSTVMLTLALPLVIKYKVLPTRHAEVIVLGETLLTVLHIALVRWKESR